MDMKTDDQIERVTKLLDDDYEKAKIWAKESGLDIEPIELGKKHKASGSVKFSSAFVGDVILTLVFDNGEKRTFNGRVIGDLVGMADGLGTYLGQIPKIGDDWHFEVNVKGRGRGVIIPFSNNWSFVGAFMGGTAGAGSGLLNRGSGKWSK